MGGMLLPYLLTQYLVLNMNLVYLPAGYLMADNNVHSLVDVGCVWGEWDVCADGGEGGDGIRGGDG